MATRTLNPIQYGAVGNGDPANAAKDTKAFADMTKLALANPKDKFIFRLPPQKCFMLEVADDNAYRGGWILDGLANVIEVGCAANVVRSKWSLLKLKPQDFKGRAADLIQGGRNQPFSNLWFKRVVLDGSAAASGRSMDTQQSQLVQIGTKGVKNIGFEDVVFTDCAADGIKTGGTPETQMDGLTLRRVHAYKMGRAALVIQGNSRNILVEDCDGDENQKAWLDSEPTSGKGPSNITLRRSKLFCGVTSDGSGGLRRPTCPLQLAGLGAGEDEVMRDVLVEDCQVDGGIWLRNIVNLRVVRTHGDSFHEDVPGYQYAIHMDERVEAEFVESDFEGTKLGLYATHHNSVGRIPKKLWFTDTRISGSLQAMSLDSAEGLSVTRGRLEARDGVAGGEMVFVTNSLRGQNLTGYSFNDVSYDRASYLAHFRAKDASITETIGGILSAGNGENPFKYSGRTANITPGTVVS